MGRAAPATRDRVQAAARRLRYRPNRLVHGMQSGTSRLVGVMMPFSEFYSPILTGLHDALVDSGFTPVCVHARVDAGGRAIGMSELDIVHHLVELRVDGIVNVARPR